jgi:hypothetical protein
MTEYTATASLSSGAFDDFMARMTGMGRASIERHLALCEKELRPDHVRVWKRLAGLLARLTPAVAPYAGPNAVRFYIPDGKYRLQMFALEDLRVGDLAIYLNDTRAAALREGVLVDADEAASNLYRIANRAGDERLLVEPLTTRGTTSAPDYYKHMLGWHRTAIRITLGRNPTPAQIRAAEAMCMIAVPDPAIPSVYPAEATAAPSEAATAIESAP